MIDTCPRCGDKTEESLCDVCERDMRLECDLRRITHNLECFANVMEELPDYIPDTTWIGVQYR